MTPAERKRAQRERDHKVIYSPAKVIDGATIDGLLLAVGHAIAEGQTRTLEAVLTELGRRGGLTVTTRLGLKGARVKA